MRCYMRKCERLELELWYQLGSRSLHSRRPLRPCKWKWQCLGGGVEGGCHEGWGHHNEHPASPWMGNKKRLPFGALWTKKRDGLCGLSRERCGNPHGEETGDSRGVPEEGAARHWVRGPGVSLAGKWDSPLPPLTLWVNRMWAEAVMQVRLERTFREAFRHWISLGPFCPDERQF